MTFLGGSAPARSVGAVYPGMTIATLFAVACILSPRLNAAILLKLLPLQGSESGRLFVISAFTDRPHLACFTRWCRCDDSPRVGTADALRWLRVAVRIRRQCHCSVHQTRFLWATPQTPGLLLSGAETEITDMPHTLTLACHFQHRVPPIL